MDAIRLGPNDNVEVITAPAGRGAIPRGHKSALRPIRAGEPIVKFSHVIGTATADIAAGEHVHVHNVAMPDGHTMNAVDPHAAPHEALHDLPTHFMGYPRQHGRAGIRNYIVVVASVNCSATVVKAVCRKFEGLKARGIDGVIPVTHSSGCAQAVGGLAYRVLNRTLAGWVYHPNVVGAVVIGLGCEGTTFKSILQAKTDLALQGDAIIEHLSIQDVGGTAAAIAQGIEAVQRVLDRLPTYQRQRLPVSHLNLALNCGGSDAFSSLTANPALGLCSDQLVNKGATVALAEIPECTGAEALLYQRSANDDVRARLQAIFAWWQDYATRQHVTLNENLAPGNIAGGITTIIEKSLGAVAKAGSTPLTEVVDYSYPVTKPGFVLMNTPGFDPVSVTGLVAGGCNIVAFTTGRGSVYGCGIAPTIKIATTSELFSRMANDMDIDAGLALQAGGLERVAAQLYRFCIDVASGTATCSEALGLGWEEFAPWPIGETL